LAALIAKSQVQKKKTVPHDENHEDKDTRDHHGHGLAKPKNLEVLM